MSVLTPLHVYVRELEKLLNDEIERLKEEISFGHVESHSEYKNQTGKIAGLRAALDYLAEADRISKEKFL